METLFVILHRRNFRSGASLCNALRNCGDQFLAEVETRFNVCESSARNDVTSASRRRR
jgi:Flp pilus assembly protein TadB